MYRFHRTDFVLEASDHAEPSDVLRVSVSRRAAAVLRRLHPDAVSRVLLQPGKTSALITMLTAIIITTIPNNNNNNNDNYTDTTSRRLDVTGFAF